MALDPKILETRLITRESTLFGSSISQCAIKLHAAFKALMNEAEDSSAHSALLREILLFQLETTKSENSIKISMQEILEYQELEAEVERKIDSTEKNIERLTEELRQQHLLRKHKEESEMMAKIVNKLPSRSALKKDIDNMHETSKKLNEQLSSTESRVQMRMKQFNLLIYSILDLQKTLAEDEELQRLQNQLEAANNEEEEMEANECNDLEERELESGSAAHEREDRQITKKPRIEENYSENNFESHENDTNEASENGITAAAAAAIN